GPSQYSRAIPRNPRSHPSFLRPTPPARREPRTKQAHVGPVLPILPNPETVLRRGAACRALFGLKRKAGGSGGEENGACPFYFLGEAVSHRKRSQVHGRRAVPHETACGHNHRRRQADALPAIAASTRRQIDLSGEGGLYAGKRRPTVAGLAHADSAAGSRGA